MTRLPLVAWLAMLATACSDDAGDDGGGDGDADGDVDGDADGDVDACSLECGELYRELPWDQQEALPTCEDSDTWSQPPEVLNVQRDEQDRVVHWEITLRYENNHQFVVRYDVGSFCPDGTFETLDVAAESYDPMGTWSCNKVFFCL
jgi:hypothetical protein